MSLFAKSNMRMQIGGYLTGTADDLTEHGYLRICRTRKRQLSQMTMALDIETAKRRVPDGAYYISRKIDGEFAMLIYDGTDTAILNPGGTLRAGAPFLADAAAALKKAGIKKALIGGEFYVQRPDGKRARVHDIVRIGRKPETEADLETLAFAAFNIYDLDGEDLSMRYGEALKRLGDIFGAGGRVHAVETVTGENYSAVRAHYNEWVVGGGDEGVVLRSDTAGMFKIKPRHTLDLAVIGFTESTNDRAGMLHDMLLGIVRADRTYQIVCKAGGGFSDEQRREILITLQARAADSDFHEVNSSRVAYQMVRPGLVAEIQCLDIIAETSRGNSIDKMVLGWNADDGRWEGLRRLPLCSVISPGFIRFRDDKEANSDDVRLSQLTDIVAIPEIDRVAEDLQLPPSTLIKRKAARKELRGAVMVRKLVMWKTNKDEVSKDYPAYVLQLTDYSPSRKDPLKYEMRVSSSEKQMNEFFAAWEKKYFVSGWKLAE